MTGFKNISIKNKLILIQVLTAIVALIICCVIFVLYDINAFKNTKVKNTNSIAEIVGVNAAAPLLFDDQESAMNLLLNLKSNSSILNARILDKTGKEFAHFSQKGSESFIFPKAHLTNAETKKVEGDDYIVRYKIYQDKEFLGAVQLHAKIIDLRIIITNYIKIAGLVLLSGIIAAYFISIFLHRLITTRLYSMIFNTKKVTETGDYSIRISTEGNDELAVLSKELNNMMAQIEKTTTELDHSLSLMNATIESTADGILVVDLAGKISLLNQQLIRLLKIPNEILITKDDDKALGYFLQQLKEPEKFLNKVNELYANPELESYDVFELKDGTSFERYSIPQRTTQKEIIGRVWSFRDVTIRNRAVEELHKLNEQLEQRVNERTADLTKTQVTLQQSEEKYRKIVEESGDAVYSSDFKGFLIYVNPFCTKLTGYSENELVGMHFSELIAPDWKEQVAKFYQEQFENKVLETTFSFPIITKSGERIWVEQSVTQLQEGNLIKGHNAIVRDITERKNSEEIIKQKSEELSRSNQELEQFAYVASHDLQEPLRTISNFVGLLDAKISKDSDQEAHQYFGFIENATLKMQNLIKDLLEFSRTGKEITFETIDLNDVLKEVISDIRASIKESKTKITIPDLPTLIGNKTELKRLFQNLLSNAIKFRKVGIPPQIEITVKETNLEYLFAIKDNGIGIDEQYKDKLFVMFQRLNSTGEYPGTGIGLATCKKIVLLHSGKIWFESKLGEGSVFYFTISKKLEKTKEEKATAFDPALSQESSEETEINLN